MPRIGENEVDRGTWIVLLHLQNTNKSVANYAKACANAKPPSIASLKVKVEQMLVFDKENQIAYDLARHALSTVNWDKVVEGLQDD